MNTSANRSGLHPGSSKTSSRLSVATALALGLLLAGLPAFSSPAAIPNHGVAAGMLLVEQIPMDTNNVAEVSLAFGINTFRLGASCNRGDYNLLIGPGAAAAQDEALGVALSCVTENGRDNFGSNAYPASGIERNGSGTYRIVSFLSPGDEYNVNVAGAWFPYDRYLGGFARNAADVNGGTNDTFTGSPGLVLGTHFKGVTSGKSIVDLRSFGIDSRTDGVLLVNHAKDEDNFGLSQVNTTDGTWNLFIRDVGQGTYGTYEQDPVAFVFIPRTNTALISGRFNGNGSIALFSGVAPQFTVTNVGTGRWDLRIPGFSPTNGVLIISPEGGGNVNGDNIVSYQAYPDGSGWEIQSRDTPDNGLQTPVGPSGQPEAVASFVFIPAPSPGIAVSPTNGLVTTGSGQSATFSVVLQAPPTADVAISLASSDPGKGVAAPGTLLFGTTDWYLPQTVTVTGQTGALAGAYTVSLASAISADPGYQGLNPDDVSVLSVAARAALVSPANNALQVRTSPALQVTVTNTTAGNLLVKFYGREAPTVFPGPDFTVAVMPDTQMYTGELGGGKKEMMFAQTEWAITNRVSHNVAYVTQLGDISNNGDNPAYFFQWLNATNAMYRLENPVRTQLADGMAYGVAVGNHEFTPNGTPFTGTSSNYDTYFGVPHFAGREYYAGHYGTNNNNHYDFFSAGGLDFVVVYFEYNTAPQASLLTWADDILRTNSNRRAIIVTHNMGNTQTPIAVSDQWTAIYTALKTNSNLFLMLAGHVTGQGRREDTFNGNIVRTFVQDYQGWANGGNGFMRSFNFSPSNNVVVVQTFSAVTGEYLTDEASEFFFNYDLQPTGPGTAGPYTVLATNTGVAPGNLSSCLWPGLQPNKAYEWYVTVTDQSGLTVTSPAWRFTTALTNTPPSIANLARTIVGDAPSLLTLLASDINGDPLSFQTNTLPSNGLLQNFDPAAGTVTFWPPRGFRGTDRFIFSANDGQASSPVASMNLTIVAPPDTNANGLPDAWEAAYAISNPAADADGDGQSNLEEYLANTNPTNAASVLRITDVARQSNGHIGLTWPTVGGTRYRVQFANGDTKGGLTGAFNEVTRSLATEMDAHPPGSLSTQTFTDDFTLTGPATNQARYYRLRVVQ